MDSSHPNQLGAVRLVDSELRIYCFLSILPDIISPPVGLVREDAPGAVEGHQVS